MEIPLFRTFRLKLPEQGLLWGLWPCTLEFESAQIEGRGPPHRGRTEGQDQGRAPILHLT